MNNDYMNNEMEIDLMDLFKDLIKNYKRIMGFTFAFGFVVFCVLEFFVPKYYSSSTEVAIVSSGQPMDYSAYLKSGVVIDKLCSKTHYDASKLYNNIDVEKNSNNYHIVVTTTNPKTSYICAKDLITVFKKEMADELQLSSITIIDNAKINRTAVSPNVKKNTLIGTFVGLVGSVCIVVLRFLFDKHLRNAKEAEMFLGVDVLAEIPLKK